MRVGKKEWMFTTIDRWRVQRHSCILLKLLLRTGPIYIVYRRKDNEEKGKSNRSWDGRKVSASGGGLSEGTNRRPEVRTVDRVFVKDGCVNRSQVHYKDLLYLRTNKNKKN